MAKYLSIKISEILEMIDEGELILPAMQRNFVWPESKVCFLFDSLLRDYPIGTFLLWQLDKETFNQYAFNCFIDKYDEEKGKMQRGKRASADLNKYTAVLDGQQRITSLYLGIKGSYRVKRKGKRVNKQPVYEDKFLAINMLYLPTSFDDNYKIEFKFADEIETLNLVEQTDESGNVFSIPEYWVRISTICNEEFDESEYVDDFAINNPNVFNNDNQMRKDIRKMLKQLKSAVVDNENISYYLAKKMPLPNVVDVFVRVNSGAEKLSPSDLMLSVASGEVGNQDIHMRLKEAVDSINTATNNPDTNFVADTEFVLTASLLCCGFSSLSLKKPENWQRDSVNKVLENFDDTVDSISKTVRYIDYLGFNGRKLSSSLILPIVYYFYKNGLPDNHKESNKTGAACDRVFIRQWLIRALVNNVFMDGTGSTLIAIRNVLDTCDKKYFPLDDLMFAKIKKPLNVGSDQIDEILEWKYGDGKIVPLLMELTMETSSSGTNYDVDHIWPKGIINSKKEMKRLMPLASDEEKQRFKEQCNKLPNLELLSHTVNIQKRDMLFEEWKDTPYVDENYYNKHLIPKEDYKFKDFLAFTEERSKMITKKIATNFPDDFNEIINMYHLTLPK